MEARPRQLIAAFIILVPLLLCAFPVRALTPEQWKQDLATLRGAIAAHPAPYVKTSKVALDEAADVLAGQLGALRDYEVVARMAALVAMLGDGHSRVELPMIETADLFGTHGKTDKAKIEPFGFFPIRLTHAADGMVVTRATQEHKDLLGAQLIGIGDKSIAEVEASLRPIVHGDNAQSLDYLLPSFIVVPELLAAVGVAPPEGHLAWRFRLADEKEISRQLVAIHDGAALQWNALDEIVKPAPDRRHWITKLPSGVIHARLTDILNDPHETVAQFADTLFAMADATPDATLALDLRDNRGGDNTLDDAIVRGAIRTKRLWEPGRFFVLINTGTFSAASNLVTLLERWTPAIFIGEPTGGAPNGYGDPKRTVLPNSGLTVRVSSLYWQVSDPKDKRDATAPLIPAAPSVAAVRAHRDLALNAVNSLLAKPVPATGLFAGQCEIQSQMLKISFELTEEQALLNLPALKIATQPLRGLERGGETVTGEVTLGDQPLRVHGRIAGSRFLGWVDFAGRPFAFAAERASSNSPTPSTSEH
jgi:hypothetical protein